MGNLQNVNYTFICTVHVPVYQIMDVCGLNVRIINQYSDMNGFHGSCQLKLCLARDHLHEIIICYYILLLKVIHVQTTKYKTHYIKMIIAVHIVLFDDRC